MIISFLRQSFALNIKKSLAQETDQHKCKFLKSFHNNKCDSTVHYKASSFSNGRAYMQFYNINYHYLFYKYISYFAKLYFTPKSCLQIVLKISYSKRIVLSSNKVLSVKKFQHTIKIFSVHQKNMKTLGVRNFFATCKTLSKLNLIRIEPYSNTIKNKSRFIGKKLI